jgi:hypothetical protein
MENIAAWKAAFAAANISQELVSRLEAANTALRYLKGHSFEWVTFVIDDVDVDSVDAVRVKARILAKKGEDVFKTNAWVDSKLSTNDACEILKGMLGE